MSHCLRSRRESVAESDDDDQRHEDGLAGTINLRPFALGDTGLPFHPQLDWKDTRAAVCVTWVTAILRRVPEATSPSQCSSPGTGTNLQALLDTVHGREARVVAVTSSVADIPALERARDRRVSTEVFPPAAYPDAGPVTGARGLAGGAGRSPGRLRRIHGAPGPAFLARFPARSSTSACPCCRPFRGWAPSSRRLSYGVKVFGVTVHFVDAGVDSGPVILQRAVELPDARPPPRCWTRCVRSSTPCCRRPSSLFARGALSGDRRTPPRAGRGRAGGDRLVRMAYAGARSSAEPTA